MTRHIIGQSIADLVNQQRPRSQSQHDRNEEQPETAKQRRERKRLAARRSDDQPGISDTIREWLR